LPGLSKQKQERQNDVQCGQANFIGLTKQGACIKFLSLRDSADPMLVGGLKAGQLFRFVLGLLRVIPRQRPCSEARPGAGKIVCDCVAFGVHHLCLCIECDRETLACHVNPQDLRGLWHDVDFARRAKVEQIGY
jgi:hypothetical protein